ncbi:MAG: hypothetical protein ABSC63_16445 [Candidatus Binataceae bacterium]|jgi:hypothetical protein
MADQKALYESISRRGSEGARSDSARRQRTIIFALVGILLAIAVVTQLMTSGNAQRPVAVDPSHTSEIH